MAEAALEATVRVKLDTREARGEADRLGKDLEKEKDDRDREREKSERRREKAGASKRRAGVGGRTVIAPLAGRAAKFAGGALALTAVLQFLEFSAPVISEALGGILERRIKELGLDKVPGTLEAVEEMQEAIRAISDTISDVRSTITAGFKTATGVGEAARAVGILSGKDLSNSQVIDFAAKLFEVTQALERSDRQQRKLSREAIFTSMGRIVSGGGK